MSTRSPRLRFTVVSDPYRFNFPIDMLRYDACWPEHQGDVRAVEDPAGHRADDNKTRVTLLSDSSSGPTGERWASFGWHVDTVEKTTVEKTR